MIGLVATIIFGIVAIISIIVAVELARKKKPVWAYRTEQVIGLGTNAPSELKLTFNDKQVSSVFRTILVFFNRGNEAIRSEDVTDNVNFLFRGAEILREPGFKASKPQICMDTIRVTQNSGDAVKLDFKYLSHNDGVAISVLHTKCDGIKCEGNIIDSKEIQNIGNLPISYPRVINIIIRTAPSLFLLIFGIVTLITSAFIANKQETFLAFLLPIMLILAGLVGIRDFLPYFKARRFPKWSIESKEFLNDTKD